MENKSLLAIVNQAMDIERLLMESGGEVNEAIERALAVNGKELAEKVDGYHMVIERFEALETHYKSRSDFFKTISGQCKNVVTRLKDNIKFSMQEMGADEIRGNDMRFKLSPTPGRLIIEDREMIPVEFKIEVVETKIDEKAIKEALKTSEVPGAKLEPGVSLRTFANTPDRKSKKEVANV